MARGAIFGTVLAAAIVAAAAFGPPKGFGKPGPKPNFGQFPKFPKPPNVNIPKPSFPKTSGPKTSGFPTTSGAPKVNSWGPNAPKTGGVKPSAPNKPFAAAAGKVAPQAFKPPVPKFKPPFNKGVPPKSPFSKGASQKPQQPGFPHRGPPQKPQQPGFPPRGFPQKPQQGRFGQPAPAPPQKFQPPPRNLGQKKQGQPAATKAGFKPPQIPKLVTDHIAALQKQAKEQAPRMSAGQLPKHHPSTIAAAKRRLDPRVSGKQIPMPGKMQKLPQLPKMPKIPTFPKVAAMPKIPGFFKAFSGKSRTGAEM